MNIDFNKKYIVKIRKCQKGETYNKWKLLNI